MFYIQDAEGKCYSLTEKQYSISQLISCIVEADHKANRLTIKLFQPKILKCIVDFMILRNGVESYPDVKEVLSSSLEKVWCNTSDVNFINQFDYHTVEKILEVALYFAIAPLEELCLIYIACQLHGQSVYCIKYYEDTGIIKLNATKEDAKLVN